MALKLTGTIGISLLFLLSTVSFVPDFRFFLASLHLKCFFLQVMKTIHGTQGTCWSETATCACCVSTRSTHCRFFPAILQPSIRSRTLSSFVTNVTVTLRQSGVYQPTTVGTTSLQLSPNRSGMMETTPKWTLFIFILALFSMYIFTYNSDKECFIT